MSFLADKRKRKTFIIITSIALVLSIIVGACAIYLGDCYRSDQDAIQAFSPMNAVTLETLDDGTMALADAGIKLYGGVSGSCDAAVNALLANKLNFNPEVRCDHHDHEHGEEGHNCGSHGCGSNNCGSHDCGK